MSIAICGLVNDGIVLGTDSTATTRFANGTVQTYRDQPKLFQVHPEIPVAAAVIGLADIAGASVPNLMHTVRTRLSGSNPSESIPVLQRGNYTVEQIVDAIKTVLFDEHYLPHAQDLPADSPLTVFVAGYSSGSAQAEFVEIAFQKEHVIGPKVIRPVNSAQLTFGGTYPAAFRLNMGYSLRLPDVLVEMGLIEDGAQQETRQKIQDKLNVPLLWPGSPLSEAARLVEFLVDTEIKYSYFTADPDLVGGKIQLATISPRHGFRWIHRPQ